VAWDCTEPTQHSPAATDQRLRSPARTKGEVERESVQAQREMGSSCTIWKAPATTKICPTHSCGARQFDWPKARKCRADRWPTAALPPVHCVQHLGTTSCYKQRPTPLTNITRASHKTTQKSIKSTRIIPKICSGNHNGVGRLLPRDRRPIRTQTPKKKIRFRPRTQFFPQNANLLGS